MEFNQIGGPRAYIKLLGAVRKRLNINEKCLVLILYNI